MFGYHGRMKFSHIFCVAVMRHGWLKGAVLEKMLKRKYGDRAEWNRVEKRKYAQTFLDTKEFKGYITLLNTIRVTEPLSVRYGDKNICIVDDGYMWLQQFPLGKNHSVTTMFDANGNVVQWYVDICNENGVDNGIPWMDDLFLDVVALSSGEVIQLDVDELEEALKGGIINKNQYVLALEEANKITKQICNEDFSLIKLANIHKQILEAKLK
jgi:uncharacterized protein